MPKPKWYLFLSLADSSRILWQDSKDCGRLFKWIQSLFYHVPAVRCLQWFEAFLRCLWNFSTDFVVWMLPIMKYQGHKSVLQSVGFMMKAPYPYRAKKKNTMTTLCAFNKSHLHKEHCQHTNYLTGTVLQAIKHVYVQLAQPDLLKMPAWTNSEPQQVVQPCCLGASTQKMSLLDCRHWKLPH